MVQGIYINCSPTYASSHSRNSRVRSTSINGCTIVLSRCIYSYAGHVHKLHQFSSISEPHHRGKGVTCNNCAADGEVLALKEIVIAANFECAAPRTNVGREGAWWWSKDTLVNHWWSHCREGWSRPLVAMSYGST